MLFWIVAGLLTFAACLAVMLPILRSPNSVAPDVEHDIEVYKDQLAEVDRDVTRGVVEASEAEQAKAEIARRILRLSGSAGDDVASGQVTFSAKLVLTIAILAVPVVSWGVYASTGSPGVPAQPLEARLQGDPNTSTVEELIARAEAHLSRDPSDARGWDVLAPIYLRVGRYPDAMTAYRNVIRLDGETSERLTGLAEAIASNAGGLITVEAQSALERAVEVEPSNWRARYMMAVAYAQEGDVAEARRTWTRMRADVGADSPWIATIDQALGRLDAQSGATRPGSAPAAGPSEEEVAAAAQLPPQEQTAMIEAMVEGLDQRLRENPADAEGWMRLVRSYVVLGRIEEAQAAFGRGLDALGPSTGAGELSELAVSLGLGTE
jgi:cytochrome c-type biogenesis protein CcmH